MRAHPIGAVVAVLVASGCTSADDETFVSRWPEPASYTYTLDSQCGEQPLIGRFKITVASKMVADVTALDDAARNSPAMTKRELVPTLGRLLQYADIARSADADVATADFDSGDGHPTKISIDQKKGTVDDELCYTISDYVPAAPSP
jgi:hypothetical protein